MVAVKTRDFIHFTNETANISVPRGISMEPFARFPKLLSTGLIRITSNKHLTY
jgi:hypothetical protein